MIWGNILTTTGALASTLGQDNSLRYRAYVYDQESELYYLQSRYYDPEVGRFLNGDALASTGQGMLGYNLFTYCNNNPVSNLDTSGCAHRPVGAGLQFEVDIGNTVVGIEIILYWDVDECGEDGAVIAVYVYGGVSVGVNDPTLAAVLGIITDNSDLLLDQTGAGTMLLASMISDSFDIGVSGFLVFGNEDFNSTKDYEESFTSIGGTFLCARAGIAYSETCFSLSLGGNLISSSIFPSGNVTKTYYQQIMQFELAGKSQSFSTAHVG